MSPSEPRVSVVIPVYNRAGSVRAAIDSVLRQSVRDIEVIVVDDASRDDTVAQVERIGDPRLRLIRHDVNGGAGAARNTGLRAGRAPMIAFQDSDDEWLPLKLGKQLARMAGPDAPVAAYCGMLVFGALCDDGAARPTMRYLPDPALPTVQGDLRDALLRRSLISTQTLMARREVLLSAGGFDESLRALEDWECAIRLAACGPIGLVDEPLVLQRFSPNSITRDSRWLVEARAAIVDKHATTMLAASGCLPEQHRILAGGFRALGDRARALRHARLALAGAPLRPLSWACVARILTMAWNRRGET